MGNRTETFRSENVGASLHEMTFELGAQRSLSVDRGLASPCSEMVGNWDGGCLF